MTVPTVGWNENTPAGSDLRSEGDDRIRELKTQIREVIALDHVFASSGADATNGMHKAIRLVTQTSPTTDASHGFIFQKDAGAGVLELFWKDYLGNEVRLTNGGKLVPHSDYTTGTVTLAASTAVVGSGTLWNTGSPKNVAAGMLFYVTGDPKAYVIASVNSDTSITLAEAYEGTTGAGISYTITPAWGDKINTILAMHRNVTNLLKAHTLGSTMMIGSFTGDGGTQVIDATTGACATLTGSNLHYTYASGARWMMRITARSSNSDEKEHGEWVKFNGDGANSTHFSKDNPVRDAVAIPYPTLANSFSVVYSATNEINKTGVVHDFIIIKTVEGTA